MVKNYLTISANYFACNANMISYASLGDRDPAERHFLPLPCYVEAFQQVLLIERFFASEPTISAEEVGMLTSRP